VAADNRVSGKPFQIRRPCVIRVERLDDSGPGDSRDIAEQHDRERHCRECEVPDLGQRSRTRFPLRGDWEPAEPDREDEDQHESRHELGDDGKRKSDDGDPAIGRPPDAQAGEDAAEDPERDDDQKREHGKLHGVDERGLDDVPDRRLRRGERVTEVSSHDPTQPVDVLDDCGSVRAVLVVVCRHRLFGGVRPEHRASHVAGQELRGREDDRAEEEERDQREARALEDVACDGGSAVCGSGCRRAERRQPGLLPV